MDQPSSPRPSAAPEAESGPPGSLVDLRHALDAGAIVAATDVTGTITFVNDQFCRISKYSRAELLGGNHRLVSSGHHSTAFFQGMYRTIARGSVWRGGICNRAKDGTLYWVDTTIVPFMSSDGRPYQYVAIRHDITDRKRHERILRDQTGLVQMGRLAAVVAHEIRNPLAGIRGTMQVFDQRLPADSAEREIIREVIQRVDTLNDIVSDLLQFAKPSPLVRDWVTATDLVGDTVALVQDDPRLTTATIETRVGDALLFVDRQQLKLTLLNLLLNAAQAMSGRGVIRIESDEDEQWHDIRVIDQGPGISDVAREHLFEPFFTTKSRGTGLGLATARRIVDRHGGTLELLDAPAGGTVARVRLPRVRPPVDAPPETSG